MTKYIYLHGFASSPNSAKAKYLRDGMAEYNIDLQIPDLNWGDFYNLTITRQITQISREFPQDNSPVTLIGSSLGGLTASYIAEKYHQVQRLILLAPAFGFLSHWLPKLGTEQLQLWKQKNSLMVYHYGEQRQLPLSYNFFKDTSKYHEEILQHAIPTLILHGKQDDVIPIEASRNFAEKRPWVELREFDSDHLLTNVMPEIFQEIRDFCQLQQK